MNELGMEYWNGVLWAIIFFAFIVVILFALICSRTAKKLYPFRVTYILTYYDLESDSVTRTPTFKIVSAKNAEEAITEVKERLDLQIELETKDLGISCSSFSDFEANILETTP